jgi:hypothetical protein|tara:strand:+ start:1392 stop:2015 length:624 start_codon:yes stop_codon:yes gene_type:complete
MGRLPFIIATSLVVITGRTISPMIAKALIALGFMTAQEVPQQPVVQPIPVVQYEASWKCDDCTPEEKYVLKELQNKTRITDRNALATILGNIKQESLFIPNICEGGARVSYNNCHSGGYGLIQWTSVGRYNNLGKFCNKYDCDPSSLEGQTSYMINESTFQRYLPEFEGSGKTVRQYMVPAYYWLGWGIKGNREIYAYEYTKKLQWS